MQSLLALSRMAVGLGFLTIPKSFAALFAMPFTPEAAIGCRMAGTRDLVLGALLYTCRSQASTVITNDAKTDVANQQPQRKREWNDTQRALLLAAGVVVDAFDVLSCLWCYHDGSLPLRPMLLLGGGASLLLDLGVYCWHF